VTTPNEDRYDPAGNPRDRSLRVGDKERETVSELLRHAHVEGRLDNEEFQVRLERCLTAKTYADLDSLIADFPRQGANAGPRRERSGWRPWPVPVLFVPVALIAAFAVGGHVGWLAIPLLFFFVARPLMWRAWGGGPGRGPSACGPRRTSRVL
jgi:hypothetical protein